MNSLLTLQYLKAKGFVRKIYSKPLSAVLTTAGVIASVALAVFMAMLDIPAEEKGPFEVLTAMYLGFSMLLMVTMLASPRTAYVNENDANYLLVGPFKTSQIIAYGLIGSLSGALLYAVLSYAYVIVFFGALFEIKAVDYISLLMVSLLLFYCVFSLVDMLYIRLMNSKYQVWIKRGIIAVVAAALAMIFGYYYFTSQSKDFFEAFSGFMGSTAFNLVPLVGWAKMALLAFHYGNLTVGFGGLLLLAILAVGFTWATISAKEIDPETILEDAQWYTEMKNRTRKSQSNLNLNLKVHEVKETKWGSGARAISSRMMLDMRKTRSFITRQEVMLTLLYLAISFFSKFSYSFYSRYVSIILFIITMSSNYNDELKHHYIYLIPDKPVKKLLALLGPTVLKLVIIIFVMMTLGIILQPTLFEYVSAIFELCGYGLLFISANIWSLRLLKGNDNQVANQFIKMFLILLALVPSVVLGLVFNLVANLAVFSFVSSLVNILVAMIFILASRNLVSGAGLNEE